MGVISVLKIIGDLEKEKVARECVERRGSKQEFFRDEGESLVEVGGARNMELEGLENQGGGQNPRSQGERVSRRMS